MFVFNNNILLSDLLLSFCCWFERKRSTGWRKENFHCENAVILIWNTYKDSIFSSITIHQLCLFLFYWFLILSLTRASWSGKLCKSPDLTAGVYLYKALISYKSISRWEYYSYRTIIKWVCHVCFSKKMCPLHHMQITKLDKEIIVVLIK